MLIKMVLFPLAKTLLRIVSLPLARLFKDQLTLSSGLAIQRMYSNQYTLYAG